MNQILRNLIEKSYPLLEMKGNEARKALYFKIDGNEILPGQFFMLNYYGCQKPYSVSSCKKENDNSMQTGFIIEDRGPCSKKMTCAKKGDYFGLTGPLGKGFKIKDYKNFLLLAGGIGTAPMSFLMNHLISVNKNSINNNFNYNQDIIKADLIIGERDKNNIIYSEEINDIISNDLFSCTVYTDNGSAGKKGFPTDNLEDILKTKKFDTACICGPEIMMVKAANILKNYIDEQDIQICMERYMKCGIGLCGSCVLDDIGDRVCVEGPVFNYSTLKKTREFGNYKRDSYGIIRKE